MFISIMRTIMHIITGTREFYYRKLAAAARDTHNKSILEIGSGKSVNGKLAYSARHLFDSSNQFICSDLNPAFGHMVLDVTTMQDTEKYDVILCLNVLEHVFETQRAVQHIQRALKKGGVAYVAVPYLYPLHDEPEDYWRFSEYGLKRLLGAEFGDIRIFRKGLRRWPFGYFVEARK